VTSTFLHEDQKVPPDEEVERDAPECRICGQQMWVVRVETVLSDNETISKRTYECGRCGAKQSVKTTKPVVLS
jgi:ribosomal protein S14